MNNSQAWKKKKWKLEIWQSGKITRDLCLSPDYEGSERDDCGSSEKRVGPFLMML